ncbi:hypothetical protein EOD41_19175 [Mucilaginibacter limnophilus]|uniref:Uncharacterized protein n=1 Tax=Mucilaginibacter limnophilus TaxID=1932778 RepID=A0A3S2WVV5_9SPHI|nr:hypothetical protein [Mucilaginibacter limnophilus]RVT97288.1 hypothetical protein EOD41_19175 [Mucilaginibacter limnophilus]
METIKISVAKDKQVYEFEVHDFAHHEGERCKFEVYDQGTFIAAFEPDDHEYLRICKNPGKVDQEVLHLIADKLESMHL